jgi:hypothetical protein
MSPEPPVAPQVLIADDQPAVSTRLVLLKEEGWRVVTVAAGWNLKAARRTLIWS